jgi:choline dehydrogenase-like flavoprotein
MKISMKTKISKECADVLIVGAGPCGIAVADSLRAQGIASVILDAGVVPPVIAGHQYYGNMQEYRELLSPYLDVDQSQWRYRCDSADYDWIRVRACGGRTLRWNGWLATPGDENFSFPATYGKEWPFSLGEMHALLARSSKWLGGQPSNLSPRFRALSQEIGCEVVAKVAAISGDPVRPFCAVDRLASMVGISNSAAKIQLVERSVVTRLVCGKQNIEAVEYFDLDAQELRYQKARVVVLCPSTIETTRLMLASEIDSLTDVYPLIGQCYTDHIAASYLVILPEKFKGDTIPSPLDRGATIPRPAGVRRSLEQRGGFTIELHGANPPSIYEPEVLAAAGLDCDSEVSCYSVNAIGELCSAPHRNIALADELDSLGRRIPQINIAWDNEVHALAHAMEAEAERVATALAGKGGQSIKVRKTLTLGGTGISHEASTCPIGHNENSSVVNRNGQVHGVNGLFIADASLMPTGLDCHPTVTVVALSLNTADGVIKFLSKHASPPVHVHMSTGRPQLP